MTASYLTDALDDLCRAALGMLSGEPSAEAVFAEEPGEYRWLFDRVGATRMRVRVINGVNTAKNPTDSVILDAQCETNLFAKALLSELRRLLTLHGEEGYRAEWVRFPFPRDKLKSLSELLEPHSNSGAPPGV